MTAVLDREMNTAVVSVSPVQDRSVPTAIGTFQCLVVSTSQHRKAMLVDAASDGGWQTVVCGSEASAWTAMKRQRFQLALVDLDGSQDQEALKAICQELSQQHDTLLVVCGNEGNGLEEIWARQLGVWLYLPGVSEASDMISLCEQAVPVAEKITGMPFQPVG